MKRPTVHRLSTTDLEVRGSEGRTLFGLVAPADTWTQIDNPREGRFLERFAPGAWSKTIAERASRVRLFTQHQTERLPVGKATLLREDTRGLVGEFYVPRTVAGDEALELARTGTVDGFSVGMSVVADEWDTRTSEQRRTIREAMLGEVSLVHSPAYSGALVAGVRSDRAPLRITADNALRRFRLMEKQT